MFNYASNQYNDKHNKYNELLQYYSQVRKATSLCRDHAALFVKPCSYAASFIPKPCTLQLQLLKPNERRDSEQWKTQAW